MWMIDEIRGANCYCRSGGRVSLLPAVYYVGNERNILLHGRAGNDIMLGYIVGV